jgi:hypothetical protein
MDEKIRRMLDRFVWDAHFKAGLRRRKKILLLIPVSPTVWEKYWLITRKESRGYWHGATGLIAERLDIAPDRWDRMVKSNQRGKSDCIGDSSCDYSYLIEDAGTNNPNH